MGSARINLVLTGILLLVVLLVVTVVYRKWKRAMKTIKTFRRKIYSVIPHIDHPEYTNLHYSSMTTLRTPSSLTFNTNIAKVLISSIMSTYNIYGGFNPHLPSYVTLISKIGTNGALYRIFRNIYVFAFRGTMTGKDLIADFDFTQTPWRASTNTSTRRALVHQGFYRLWESHREQMEIEARKLDSKIIYITGHSLGAAIAAYSALYLSTILKSPNLYVFASPRIGNEVFMEELSKAVPSHWAHLNARDLVCDLPPSNCPTFTKTYLYDDYKNIYRSDYQTGEIVGNHHLETYAKCLGQKEEAEAKTPLWNRPSIVIQI